MNWAENLFLQCVDCKELQEDKETFTRNILHSAAAFACLEKVLEFDKDIKKMMMGSPYFAQNKFDIKKLMDPAELCVFLVDSWAISKLSLKYKPVLKYFPSYQKIKTHILKELKGIFQSVVQQNDGKTSQQFYDLCFLLTHLDLTLCDYGCAKLIQDHQTNEWRQKALKDATMIESYCSTSDFLCEAIYSLKCLKEKQLCFLYGERVLNLIESSKFKVLKSMGDRGFLHAILLLLVGLSLLKSELTHKN